MMIFGNTTNITHQFSLKRYNLFYTVKKYEIFPFVETVPYQELCISSLWIIYDVPNFHPNCKIDVLN